MRLMTHAPSKVMPQPSTAREAMVNRPAKLCRDQNVARRRPKSRENCREALGTVCIKVGPKSDRRSARGLMEGGQYCCKILPALKSHVIVIVSTNLAAMTSQDAKAPHILLVRRVADAGGE